jgi:hypothetical protein
LSGLVKWQEVMVGRTGFNTPAEHLDAQDAGAVGQTRSRHQGKSRDSRTTAIDIQARGSGMDYLSCIALFSSPREAFVMSPFPISLFALLSVAACAPVASNEPPPGGGDDGESTAGSKPRIKSGPLPPEEQIRVSPGIVDASCNAEAAQQFVGRHADQGTVRAAVSASGSKAVRVIKPDMMVTMDYRGDRLNIRVDAAGKIIGIDCG